MTQHKEEQMNEALAYFILHIKHLLKSQMKL